jgi:NTE family protein
MVAAHLPAAGWPKRRLAITAVDAQSGARVTFDATSGVALLDAVTTSGALPGVLPVVSINGRRYCDGGVHSPYGADLAAGHSVVIVLTPIAPGGIPPGTAGR